jgi:transposase
MTNRLLKQVVGIDVAQKELVVSLGKMDENAITTVYANKVFSNNEKGFVSMEAWVNKQTIAGYPLRYVMEATGVYHERFAYYLAGKGYAVSIIIRTRSQTFSGHWRSEQLPTSPCLRL